MKSGGKTTEHFISRQEAARILDIGLRTLDWQRARSRGPLAHFVNVDGRRRLLYRRRDVARYKAQTDRTRDPEAAHRLRTAISLHTHKRLLAQEADALTLSREIRQTLRVCTGHGARA